MRATIGLLLLAVLALGSTSPVVLRAWSLDSNQLTQTDLPAQARPIPPTLSADLDGSGLGDSNSLAEEVILAGGRAMIQRSGHALWQSPAGWQVVQAEVSDLDHDNRPEVTLLVWRAFQPWPVDRFMPAGGRINSFHNPAGLSCHLILIGWRRGAFGELWAGSALAEPVKSFSVLDINQDGRQELLTLAGDYARPAAAPGRFLSAWEWNGFGFGLLSHVSTPATRLLPLSLADGRTIILTSP
jgi:hypothetical protein